MSTSKGMKYPWDTTPVGGSFKAPASKRGSLATNAAYRYRAYGERWRVRQDTRGPYLLAQTCTVTRIA